MRFGFSAFRPRRFVANLLLLSFLVSAVSGVVLFLRPEGSLARWVGWSVAGLDKKHWEAVHIVGVGAFLLVALVHVWYNRRPLVAYVRERASATGWPGRVVAPTVELLAASAVMAAIVAGTLAEWQPGAAVMALRTAMRDGAFATVTPPPLADADRLTLAELCARESVPEPEALRNARVHGIAVPATSLSLGAIARANNRTPEAVYRALIGRAAIRSAVP
ncbi:MAG: DUF4405 domain-containing protein [Vicinamibacterales bacterium]